MSALERSTQSARHPVLRVLHGNENFLITAALAFMVILPLAEIVLRKAFNFGISGSTSFVQHFTIVVGMAGGAIAARENRLLSLSTLTAFLKGRWKAGALIFGNSFAAAITALLALAASQYFQMARENTTVIAYGIPVWVFQAFLPIGFALVALRLIWHSATTWRGRLISLAIAAIVVWVGTKSPIEPTKLVWPAIGLLAIATVFGAPIFTALGGIAMILLWGEGRPVSLIPLEHYSLVTNPVLPSIPLFTLAGYFLAEGGASKRLVRVFQALVGQYRGGPALVTTLVCAFFTCFTGASGVTILALGGLLMPVLIAAQYPERFALGLLTGAGALGLLFPPCLPLILYAVIAQTSMSYLEVPPDAPKPEVTIDQMFLGGLLPGLLLLLLTAWWGMRERPKQAAALGRFSGAEARRALWDAKWELLLPVIALAAILAGFATPVEAAALTALYAFFTQTVVHRDLRIFKDVPRVMTECGLLIGGVLLILGVAMGLTNYLIFADVPTLGAEWIQGAIKSKWTFLLVLNLFLLVVGCLMDVYSAIVVVVPLIVPMGVAFGINPIHLGIVFLANLQLGFLTPPVGMNLFLASYRFNKPMGEVIRSIVPFLMIQGFGVLVITYWPALTTAIPKLFK